MWYVSTFPFSPISPFLPSLLPLPLCTAPVVSCDWLPNGEKLVTASWDHTAKLWDFESAQVIHSLEGLPLIKSTLSLITNL